METGKLYQIAKENDITVEGFPLPENKAVTVQLGEKYFVAIDPAVLCSDREEKVCLAHEIGHCRTGAVYAPGEDRVGRGREEVRAARWAIERLVPFDQLKAAVKDGCDDLPTLAEHFEVTNEFMYEVLMHYRDRN